MNFYQILQFWVESSCKLQKCSSASSSQTWAGVTWIRWYPGIFDEPQISDEYDWRFILRQCKFHDGRALLFFFLEFLFTLSFLTSCILTDHLQAGMWRLSNSSMAEIPTPRSFVWLVPPCTTNEPILQSLTVNTIRPCPIGKQENGDS